MMHYTATMVARGLAVAAFLGVFAVGTVQADDDEIRLRVELKPTDYGDDAEGDAEWRMEPDRLRFRVDVQDVERDGKGTVRVLRNGDVVFEDDIKIDDGQGRLELDSDDGDEVPILEEGDVVKVADRKDKVALTGELKKD